jgi:hypothetical protein
MVMQQQAGSDGHLRKCEASPKIANAALELLSAKNPEVLCANAVQTFIAGTW